MQGFTKLQSTKNNIKQAIINRGVPVASSDTFASYAQKVINIITEGDTPSEKAALQDTIEREITSIEVRGVTYIGYGAFSNCTNLSTANFPNVTSINSHAFSNCRNLSTANFPNVTNMGQYAFSDCRSLSTANFPNVTSIDSYAFSNCRNLSTANFPKVTNMGQYAFSDCTNLSTINFPNVTNIGTSAFNNCRNLSTANFPNVTSINSHAFSNCRNLSTANFPNVTNMRQSAFNNCTNLKRLELGANQVCTLETTSVFNNSGVAAGTGYVYVPLNLVDSYKAASNWVTYKEQIRALPDPTQLKTLTINNNIPTATYTYIINGEASAVTGNVLTNIPKYSVIEYIIEADGYTTVKGSIVLEDNATIDVTMTIPSWHSFTQPVLTANGTLGGGSFAAAGSSSSSTYAAWKAFDAASGSTYFRPASGSYDLIFYNPYPLKVSQLVLTYMSSSYSDYSTIILSVSDDNATWAQLKSFTVSRSASQTLAVNSSTGYLYYKITFTRGTSVRLKHCAITAQEYS